MASCFAGLNYRVIVRSVVHQELVEDMPNETCQHIEAIHSVKQPKRHECQECIKTGAIWVHLRTCQECGVTLCCDSSPNKHASKHARATQHPVIASAQPGERWLYCYPDEAFAMY
jgi:uncharacterized UBP type Zn finger protein